MKLSLIFSLLCLTAWLVFGFVRPFGLGIINLLWAAAVVLWIRWWAESNKLPVTVTGNQ